VAVGSVSVPNEFIPSPHQRLNSLDRFMAPEVYRHQPYSETVDVYSYAMILFYLLDGKPPWPYLNGVVAVKKASDEGDRPPIPRNWDDRFQTLLKECWCENPQGRAPFSKILRVLNDYSRKYRLSAREDQPTFP
jgi:serine/threonine protein kinase